MRDLMANFDVIVLGVGGMGSATLYELARRGQRVIGFEQYAPVHQRGSSHGQTRIIRQAYYEHPDYVPLVQRAYERWHHLEQISGKHLFTSCPCLNIGPLKSELVAGVQQSATEHRLPVERLSGAEITQRFPAFQFDENWHGILEERAGFLYVEECVRAFLEQAQSLGAELRSEERVLSWQPSGTGVEVQTSHGSYSAARLIITAGAWANSTLQSLGLPLQVMRQVLLWFAPTHAVNFRRDRFPIFIAETSGGYFYGLPMIDPRGAKAAQHFGAPLLNHPDQVDWQPSPADEQGIRRFFSSHLPALDRPATAGQVCIYTVTPDKHFIIDRHPEYPQVVLACGFSGHGFKFASAIGEVLCDLAENGTTPFNLERFRLSRFVS